MKAKLLAVSFMAAVMLSEWANATGQSRYGCTWWDTSTSTAASFDTVAFQRAAPSNILLKNVAVGGVMASYPINIDKGYTRCDIDRLPGQVRVSFGVNTVMPLVGGIYQTGLSGVGIRFSNSQSLIPGGYSYRNAPSVIASVGMNTMEIVRTGELVREGVIDFDFELIGVVQDWEAFRGRYFGQGKVSRLGYFEGCKGDDLNVQMGRVAIQQIGQMRPRPFTLSVLCSGGPAKGEKLPVKVYFEGSTAGPGVLRLTPGGAEGFGISLKTTGGLNLPFARSQALGMDWVRSEMGGERYSFEAVADYISLAGSGAKPGVANATLSYILEYD
ncbi:fimbrial protein [Pseudomonas aeruginosa]|uniref:fimbrial protein n=1 Tax=Pseudomonas aeruginosa TaxID=287 RepID=UPI000BB90324|nr:fimbrial protein [Pseudomonas aeruginosa]EIU7171579.1 fimbrial protein [Pseudomonas aeruginosa]MBG7162967.1 fimbrial protein [Pseudomonas aeruginosa]PBW89474.1 hypothetical protein CJT97_26435 [Pseudomonas aeruginosa]UGR25896.1 fimbrial protein [Pseudomonas aeruginosa]HEJ1670708.1 fimbrial protein [Pseudomonas aeruginosa]